MTLKRIGFACKWLDHAGQVDGIGPKDAAKQYNTGTTTRAWCNRQSRSVAEDKLWSIMKHNIESTRKLVEKVGTLYDSLRMVRLSSDILPLFTEPDWRYFYRQSDVVEYMERQFRRVGDAAKSNNVRLSFHPGQFCVLASDNPQIVESSIEEFEYHATMARMMGYGQRFQDFKCNVHISGRRGPHGVRESYLRLSPEARNMLTIENEENSWGLDDCLTLRDLCPIVLDIHHHYCREGEYIETTDPRIQLVIESWCRDGVDRRPVIHYSQSREEYLSGFSANKLPARDELIAAGINKQKLRAHSDFYHNEACNRWALTHWSWSDIMCESKAKNLASTKLFESAQHT